MYSEHFYLLLLDKDECQSGEFTCDVNAMSINTNGSYDCQCLPPYRGDGFRCFRKSLAIAMSNTSFRNFSPESGFFFFLQVDLSYRKQKTMVIIDQTS